ncbi:hypothetical protein ACJX0J_042113, partial [Zea mays]
QSRPYNPRSMVASVSSSSNQPPRRMPDGDSAIAGNSLPRDLPSWFS